MKLLAATILATFTSTAFATDLVKIECKSKGAEQGYTATATITGLLSANPGTKTSNFLGTAKITVKQGKRVALKKEVSVQGSVERKFEDYYVLSSDDDSSLQLSLEIGDTEELSSTLINSEIPAELGGLSLLCVYKN